MNYDTRPPPYVSAGLRLALSPILLSSWIIPNLLENRETQVFECLPVLGGCYLLLIEFHRRSQGDKSCCIASVMLRGFGSRSTPFTRFIVDIVMF